MSLRPKKISVSKSSRTLIITWEDGPMSEYPLSGLRASCPCAECMGGHANMGRPGSPDMLELPLVPAKSDELLDLKILGNYAVQLSWADGHDSGIYTWEFLRELNPGNRPESVGGES